MKLYLVFILGAFVYGFFELRFLIRLKIAPQILGISNENKIVWKKYFFKRILAVLVSIALWLVMLVGFFGNIKTSTYISQSLTKAELVFVLDVSNSMLSPMNNSSRLEKASDYIRTLASAMNSSMALVVFKGNAISLCPATTDFPAFEEALSWADPGVISSAGSNIGAGIDEAMRMAIQEGTARLVIVLSDGNDTGNRAKAAAEKAKNAGASLLFIGFGGIDLLPVFDSEGQKILSLSGKQIMTAQDTASIHLWAEASRSPYIDANDPDGLSRALEEIAAFQQKISGSQSTIKKTVRVDQDASGLLAFIAMLFMATIFILSTQPTERLYKKPGKKSRLA